MGFRPPHLFPDRCHLLNVTKNEFGARMIQRIRRTLNYKRAHPLKGHIPARAHPLKGHIPISVIIFLPLLYGWSIL